MKDSFEFIRKYDQLEQLLETGADPNSQEDPDMAEYLQVVALLTDQAEMQTMPRPVEFRKKVIQRIEKRRVNRWQGLLLAAAALMISFLIFPVGSKEKSEPGLTIDPQMLDRAMQSEARTAMLQYLEETEQLLVSIRDFPVACSEDKTNINIEKKVARELLLKQKHFSPQFNTPEFLQARVLFDQLENILTGVNGLDSCTDPTELDMINEHVSKKRIISQLRHMAQTIQA